MGWAVEHLVVPALVSCSSSEVKGRGKASQCWARQVCTPMVGSSNNHNGDWKVILRPLEKHSSEE